MRNWMRNWTTERIQRALGMADERLATLIQDRRDNPSPNSVRAQEISALTDEVSLYCRALRERGINP